MQSTSPGLWDDVEPEASRRLLIAAVDAFADRGFHATTTREIAARARLSPAGVYVHYRSKVDLLYEIARTGHAAALLAVEEALAEFEPASERMRAFVLAFTAWHAQNSKAARVTQYELRALPPEQFEEIRLLRARFDLLLRAEIQRGVASGVFHVPDVGAASTAVLSLGIDVARWYRPGLDPAPEKLGAVYAQLVLAMLDRPPLDAGSRSS